MIVTAVCYLVMYLYLCDDRLTLFKNSFSSTFYTMAYNHTFIIYSFCNLDDITWGTKSLTEEEHENTKIK